MLTVAWPSQDGTASGDGGIAAYATYSSAVLPLQGDFYLGSMSFAHSHPDALSQHCLQFPHIPFGRDAEVQSRI